MAQLRKFDLQLALETARPLGEYVEDQARAIEHATTERLLEVALLAGRQSVVEQHQVRACRLDLCGELFDLA
jgi:hypothetical protein